MKKKLILILILCLGCYSYAQTVADTIYKQKKFRLGLIFSVSKNLGPDFIPISTTTFDGFLAKYDQINYKLGFNFEYEFGSKFSLNSGFNFANQNFTGTFACESCIFRFLPGINQPGVVKLKYAEVPISGRYYFPLGKNRVFIEAGIVNQFIIKTSGGPGYEQFTNIKYVLSGKLGAGFDFKIDDKFSFQLGAEYFTGLTPLFDEGKFKTETLDIKIGLVKRLSYQKK